jgi:hypothetical protein
MDLRREFIKRLATGERLTDLCREYGISRKTGSKFRKRFEEFGCPWSCWIDRCRRRLRRVAWSAA